MTIEKFDVYQNIREKEATLRLYINDPAILKQTEGNQPIRSQLPIFLKGKLVIAKNIHTGKYSIQFQHSNPNFIPVFIDYDGKLKEDK